jgi:hypothetical protein
MHRATPYLQTLEPTQDNIYKLKTYVGVKTNIKIFHIQVPCVGTGVRRKELALYIAANEVGFNPRTLTEFSLRNVVLNKK